MIKDKTKKKKVNALSDENNAKHKIEQCPSRQRQNKEKKPQYDRGMEMGG